MPDRSTILSIVPAPLLPAVSGGQKATYGLLDALGTKVKIVCITDTKSPADNHTFELKPLIKQEVKKYFAYKNYKLILEQVKLVKPESILLEQPFLGIIIYLISRKTNTPYFIRSHNIEYLRFKSIGKFWWPIMFFLERFTLRRAEGVYFITSHDRDLAIRNLGIAAEKCFVAPYGVPQESPLELPPEKITEVRKRHNISPDEAVFMFFGVLKYMPNIEALELIIQEIMPRLIARYTKKFKILVCGAGISDDYRKQLIELDSEHFIYAGFVENIDEYTQSADIVLNPVLSGGGIKTKIVEALGFNKNVVSTQTGAIGVDPSICGTKLYIVDDLDWDGFVDKIIEAVEDTSTIPSHFFNVFSWKSVAQVIINNLTH